MQESRQQTGTASFALKGQPMDKATSGSALHTPGLSDHDLAGEGGKTLRHVARYNPREKKRRIQTRGTIEHKPGSWRSGKPGVGR